MTEEINALLVVEVLGRPAEHVTQALNSLIEKLGTENGVAIMNKNINEPRLAETAASQTAEHVKNLFISFAELDLKFASLARLLEICFAYMPSSLEIVKPAELRIRLNDANAILNFLLARLHQYDAVAKRLSIENMIMQKKLRELGVQEIDVKKEAKKIKKTARKGRKSRKKSKK